MLALVAMIGTLVISSPIVVAAAVLGGTSVGLWVVFVLGVAYGPLVATFGTYAAGELLDRRGPEVLVAVTPRR
jgi:ABC-2 type transport system permease protein